LKWTMVRAFTPWKSACYKLGLCPLLPYPRSWLSNTPLFLDIL
jgi:hypothetical protein